MMKFCGRSMDYWALQKIALFFFEQRRQKFIDLWVIYIPTPHHNMNKKHPKLDWHPDYPIIIWLFLPKKKKKRWFEANKVRARKHEQDRPKNIQWACQSPTTSSTYIYIKTTKILTYDHPKLTSAPYQITSSKQWPQMRSIKNVCVLAALHRSFYHLSSLQIPTNKIN